MGGIEMRQHRYSGGIRVNDNSVCELNATTWPELVERVLNHPRQINITKEEFHALPAEQQKSVKSTSFMTAVSFLDYSGPRRDSNAYQLELAILDIDSGDLAKQIWSDPTVLSAQLGDLNHVIYRTASHTDSNPRLRLVVDIEPMPLDRQPHVLAHVAKLIGVTQWEGIKESNVLTQPMFLPCQFRGESEHPIVVARTNGRALTSDEVALEELISGEPEVRTFAATKFEADESIEFMPLKVTLEEVKAALYSIDPDCSYREWFETAAALRHQFREEEDAAAAFEMWDAWSSTGTKYPSGGEDVTYAKWKSFRPFKAGTPPVTIRTLFYHAIAAGWSIAPTLDRLMGEFLQWVAEQRSETTLSKGFAARIRSLPGLSSLAEHTLCQKVAKRYSELTGAKVSAAVIQKQLREDIRKANKEEDSSTPAWLRPFVYVSSDNKFVNTANMVEYAPEAFNFSFNEYMMPDDCEGGRPPIMATDYATNIIKIPKVVAKIYDPRYDGAMPIFTHNGISYLNTYRPTYPEPDPTKSEEAGRIFTQHLEKLIAEQDYRRIFLDFLAFIVQNPGVKIRWTIVVQSVQGAGKGLIGKAAEAVLGKGNVKPVSNTVAASQWNDWSYGCQLIIIEELHSSGQNRKQLTDGLKEALTNDDLSVNKRNTSAYTVENTTNFICFTNEEGALAISSGERRYFVIKSPIRNKAQADAMQAEGWFDQLARLHGDLAAGFRHFLLNHKISPDFNPNGNAPDSVYTHEMVQDSESPGVTLIKEAMEDPEHPFINVDFISIRHLNALMGRNYAQPSRYLREMNYTLVGRMRVGGGHPTDVWAPRGADHEQVKKLVKQANPTEL